MSDTSPSGKAFAESPGRRVALGLLAGLTAGLGASTAWAAIGRVYEDPAGAAALAGAASVLIGSAVSAIRTVTGRIELGSDGLSVTDAVEARRWSWGEITGLTVDTVTAGSSAWLGRALAGPWGRGLVPERPAPLPDPIVDAAVERAGHEPRVVLHLEDGSFPLPSWLGWRGVVALLDEAVRRAVPVRHARVHGGEGIVWGVRPATAPSPVVVARLDEESSRAMVALVDAITRGSTHDRVSSLAAAETLAVLGQADAARGLVTALAEHAGSGTGASREEIAATALRLHALSEGATVAVQSEQAAAAPHEAALIRGFGLRADGVVPSEVSRGLDPLGSALLRVLAAPEITRAGLDEALACADRPVPPSRALVIGHGLAALGHADLARQWLELQAEGRDEADPAAAIALRQAAASHVDEPATRADLRLRVARRAVRVLGSAHVVTLRCRLDALVAALVAGPDDGGRVAETERHLGPHAMLPADAVSCPCTSAITQCLDVLADAVVVALSAGLPWAEDAGEAIRELGERSGKAIAARAAAWLVTMRLGPERAGLLPVSLHPLVLDPLEGLDREDAAFAHGAAAVLLVGIGDLDGASTHLRDARLPEGGYADSAWAVVPAIVQRRQKEGDLDAVAVQIDEVLGLRTPPGPRRDAWRNVLEQLLHVLPSGARRHRDALVEMLAATVPPGEAQGTTLLRAMERWLRGDRVGALAHLDALRPVLDAWLDGAAEPTVLDEEDLGIAVALRARALAGTGRHEELRAWLGEARRAVIDKNHPGAAEVAAASAFGDLEGRPPAEVAAWLRDRCASTGLRPSSLACTVAVVLSEGGRTEAAEVMLRFALAEDADGEDAPAARDVLQSLLAARRSRGVPEPDAPPPDEVTELGANALSRTVANIAREIATDLADEAEVAASDDPPSPLREIRRTLARLARRADVGGALAIAEVRAALDEVATAVDADVPGSLDLAAAATLLVAAGGAAEAFVPWADARVDASRARHPDGHAVTAWLMQLACSLRSAADDSGAEADLWLGLLDAGDAGAPFAPMLSPPWLGAGEALLRAKRAEEAHDVLASGLEHPEARRTAGTPLRIALLRACLAVGRLREGLTRAEEALPAVRSATSIAEVEVRTVRGALLAAAGRTGEAYDEAVVVASLRQAHALWLGQTPSLTD